MIPNFFLYGLNLLLVGLGCGVGDFRGCCFSGFLGGGLHRQLGLERASQALAHLFLLVVAQDGLFIWFRHHGVLFRKQGAMDTWLIGGYTSTGQEAVPTLCGKGMQTQISGVFCRLQRAHSEIGNCKCGSQTRITLK
ncbi:hypothetical protein B0H67DRAFT_201739 [Lasiosphaeris hirsuta]|uniref:Secreted protein n=1 Tax=Lasiosphaeris hirsuta TaxID=260670 RepID=A0AA40ARS1_9PEZI|nr:hypothetical protein B0H67DRAFT_201739 [Lasiosphaeris hirsuta]